jgi:hypothetical protein
MFREAYGQVRASFEKDTVAIVNGYTFSNVLGLINDGDHPVKLYLSDSVASVRKGYLPLPDSILLGPGERRMAPLKFLAAAGLIREAVQPFAVSYVVYNGKGRTGEAARSEGVVKAVFYTRLNEEARILLQLSSPMVLLDQTSHQAQLTFYVNNEGLLPRQIKLGLTAYPQGLEIANEKQSFELAAGSRRQLTYTIKNRLRRNAATDFLVVIQLSDDSGHIVATGDVRVQTLASSKAAFSPNTINGQPGNVFELNYINMSRYLSYLQVRAKGGSGLADSAQLNYRLNLEYYLHPNGINLYDTWLAYSNPHFSLRAGGITDNLDYALNGNGFEASASIGQKISFDLFGVKNNYLLYSQNFTTLPGADVVAGRVNYSTLPMGLQVSVLHASDPLLDVYTNLWHTTGRLRTGDHQELQWEGGFSTEQPRDRPGIKYGGSAGIRYHAELPRWTLVFNDYYSSPYYGGYRRGSLELENEADYKLAGASQVFGRWIRSYNSPKYTPTADSLIYAPFNYNNTNIYEAGWRWRSGRWATVLHPYYMDQRLYSALASQKSMLHSGSDRVAADMTVSGHGRSLYTSSDLGWTNSDSGAGVPRHYTSVRLMGNYVERWWSFSYLVQYRPYYLTDELQSPVPEQFRLYSFGPAIHFPLLQGQAEANAGYMANYYSVQQLWTHLLNGQVTVGLKNNWVVSGQLYYTLYHAERVPSHAYLPYSPNNQQVRVGLAKRFAAGRQPGMVRLRLIVFEDRNGNGEQDNEEPVARGVIVRLDGQAALSDGRGRVEFSGLTRTEHQLTVDNGTEWNLAAPWALPMSRDETIRVPLVKSGRLNGRVVIEKQKYENIDPDKEGIRVIARGRNGKSYTTYTDGNGDFHFYLPVMEYELSVQAVEGAAAPTERVVVTAGAAASATFRLEDRRRKIEVKQF